MIGLALLALFAVATLAAADINDFTDAQLTTAELVRSRGYIAEEHRIVTPDGYILTLVRALNPLINRGKRGLDDKDVVFFIHGTVVTAKMFAMKTVGAKPKNYGRLNASSMSEEELNDLLGDDPASNSLALSALNFGHEVWLISRRGTLESLGHTQINDHSPGFLHNLIYTLFGQLKPWRSDANYENELTQSIDRDDDQEYPRVINMEELEVINNPKYWNFSLDEQALIDIPQAINYILNKTDRDKLAITAHSAGGALTLMMLSDKPEMAEKITKSLLWSPALYLGNSDNENPVVEIGKLILDPILENYLGPLPPFSLLKLVESISMPICGIELASRTLCDSIVDLICGPSGFQQAMTPAFLGSVGPVSSGELLSQLQSVKKGKMHHLDYMDANRNMIAYGQAQPPIYDVSRITSKTMYFWAGVSDKLVITEDIELIMADLTVPAKFIFINQSGYFNHASYFVHDQVAKQLILPSLRVLESG